MKDMYRKIKKTTPMKGFIKNTKGAVTVFITMLLIPATLISGTAVDLARIYTARSIVQDANQLAANTVLSQYNALLHDLYGVFGVAQNDEIFAQLLDKYIRITVFGEDDRDTGRGTLQLFYGSNLSSGGVDFAEGKNLGNPDVIRRQIEEYMKFRAPVIIVRELLELLDLNTFSKDAEAVERKLDIDEALAEMYEKYRQLYDAIQEADICDRPPGDVAGAVGNVSNSLQNILDEFKSLKSCLREWQRCDEELFPEEKEKLEARYKGILSSIESRVSGGRTGSGSSQGLYVTIENALNRADRFKPKFDDVIAVSKEIDAMRDELVKKVNELEEFINTEKCNEELRAALTEEDPITGKSTIEAYREILKWDDIESMAVIYKEGGYYYIDDLVKEMIRNVIYRNKYNSSDPSLTPAELASASSLGCLALGEDSGTVSALAYSGDKPATYGMPEGFVTFGGHPGDNEKFYRELSDMMKMSDLPPVGLYDEQEEEDGKSTSEKQKNMIDKLSEMIDAAYAGLTNNPLGAEYVSAVREGGDGENDDVISESESISGMTGSPVSKVISGPGDVIKQAGDYLLLLTYSTSMFSNYTSGRPAINGKTKEEADISLYPRSISDIPLSPKVNYFFQSEWEYLYNGNSDAGKNLSAISRLIYLVRMICNYITVFSVSDITSTINTIRSTFSWSPALGFLLGELARAAFVAAESLIDLAMLRAGYKVALIKKAADWICSPKGLLKAVNNVLADTVTDNGEKKDKGVTYSGYMLFFFIAKTLGRSDATAELMSRTMDLIEWNVINYGSEINCDEEKMTQALQDPDRFRLEDMKTDFGITTTVDMKMLFLSMPLMQNYSGTWKIRLPKTMPVTVTDYRGY